MKVPKNQTLKVSYEDFVSVLKEWEKYTSIRIKKLAKDMPTSFNEMGSYDGQYVQVPFAEDAELSELAMLLWKSFEAFEEDFNKVDDTHDEIFRNEQVQYFKLKFDDVEIIVADIDTDEHRGWYDLDNPMQSFVKLGKAAQLEIVQSGFLEIAVSNYKKAEKIVSEQKYEEFVKEQKRIEEIKVKSGIEKKIRELDKKQCVYCGKDYKYAASFQYFKINDEEFSEDNVLLSCNGCVRKKEMKDIEPTHGRFANK